MTRFKSPRGTYDILPDEARKWQVVEANARSVLRRSGYREIQTPLIEDAALFLRGVGEASDIAIKEMYIFKDRRGRSLALRPEGTASVVRAYIQHHLAADRDVQKLYYLGPMFRYDRPQAGRNRQFFQIGSEVIGSHSPLADIETIWIWKDIFGRIGLSNATVSLNSVGCRSCRPRFQEAIRDALSGVRDELCPDCQDRLQRNPMRILDCKVEGCRVFRDRIPPITDYLCTACEGHHATVRQTLRDLGCGFQDDPYLVRGLDYYTRTAFEIVHGALGSQSSLGGGGRYDDLVAVLGGGNVPAVGFSAGIERILLALDRDRFDWRGRGSGEGELDLFVVYTDPEAREEAFRQLLDLRKEYRVDMDYTEKSLKGQLRLAHRLGVRKVLIFGTDELKRGAVIIRDMLESEEKEVLLKSLREFLKGHSTMQGGDRVAGI
ncbi:MAG: histidine--tRNA ligase [Candidatus Glassbacteria bacterium RBG_16_58_8]|uniref:Histidine--tRNA ligase n=1 Tax=Candidatus Glassbacteria bacterium RBG_16_58_8 TaxID=1817866 RepID=A0A1F5YC36_9BACT|nr:MAG: histidine--tRNA ligase [Candidatus Glassbacteria bacterium RBG_16_58_8]